MKYEQNSDLQGTGWITGVILLHFAGTYSIGV